MKSHQFEICRALYQQAREAGSPAVSLIHLGGDQWAGNTSDGKVLMESSSGCCRWSMKYEVALVWLAKFKPIP